jgi:hypothetical protein
MESKLTRRGPRQTCPAEGRAHGLPAATPITVLYCCERWEHYRSQIIDERQTQVPFYFDESIHDQRGQFILGAYVSGPDPTEAISDALTAVGLDPDRDEFKSCAKMSEHPEQQALRGRLRDILQGRWLYRYGVVVVPARERPSFGKEALIGLRKICLANGLTPGGQDAYFDIGIFPSARRGLELADEIGVSRYCVLHPEEDSRQVKGLQLADLIAHTCGTMLLDALGLLSKTVKAGANSGYPPDLDIKLGFELWATVRYQFFNGGVPKGASTNEEFVVDVARYGLHVAESCSPELRDAALARFGQQYLGCIH